MCNRLWFITDRRIVEEYPQQEIHRALQARCTDEDIEFRRVLMDEIVITIEQGLLGFSLGSNTSGVPILWKS
ncbi:UNVERIFIED_CONTAM: hypothetical protein FKN15_054752 [Acipenser sinensis]